MTDCPRADIRDLLPDWPHGTLAPAERAAVAEHIATCAACAAEVELLRAARAAMHHAPEVSTARIAAAVRAGVSGLERAPARRRWRRATPVAAAALAAAVLGVALVTWDLRFGASGERATTPLVPGVMPGRSARPAAVRELQMGGGIGDLADDELRVLLDRLERVDALPPDTPEPVGPTFVESST